MSIALMIQSLLRELWFTALTAKNTTPLLFGQFEDGHPLHTTY